MGKPRRAWCGNISRLRVSARTRHAFGFPWWSLGALGGLWGSLGYKEISGVSGSSCGVSGVSLRFSGVLWYSPGQSGALWDSPKISGALWDALGFSWALWRFPGTQRERSRDTQDGPRSRKCPSRASPASPAGPPVQPTACMHHHKHVSASTTIYLSVSIIMSINVSM